MQLNIIMNNENAERSETVVGGAFSFIWYIIIYWEIYIYILLQDFKPPDVSILYITPHTLNNFDFHYFIANRILFYYSEVNFNHKLYAL